MDPSHADEITRFVRGTLGCQCPDDVFQSIVIGQARAPDSTSSFTRLIVGDRLLIYLLQSCSAATARDTVIALARQGQAERDAKGYNRFRLVIAPLDAAADASGARAVFEDAIGRDEKAHLHVVASREIPIALAH